jgi:hypothetical protein
MKRLMLLSTALIFSASVSMAAVSPEDLVAAYQAKGYTNIEVKTGLTQIKVEAVKGVQKVEVIYDAATGEILTQEFGRSDRDERGTKVEISNEDRDFLGDEDQGDDSDNDQGDDDDDAGDDDHDNSGSGSHDDDDDDDDHDGDDNDNDDNDGDDDDDGDDHDDDDGDHSGNDD